MVACGHPSAAMAGIQVLGTGGNAVDAAIAVSSALDVAEPFMSGLGGGGAMLIHVPGSPPSALHYGGRFPRAATRASLTAASIDKGARAMAVPGAPAGWFAAHARFGQLPIAEVFAPAIELAESGVALSGFGHGFFKGCAGRLTPGAAEIFLPNGASPGVGGRLRQAQLANTYRTLVRDGVSAFYTGSIGAEIARAIGAAGGFLDEADLAMPQVHWSVPSASTYRGRDVFSTGWPFTSYELLLALNILQALGRPAAIDSVDAWHFRIEAAKLAMIDRVALGGESQHLARGLLAPEYAASRVQLITRDRALNASAERYNATPGRDEIQPGTPADFIRECTTHFDVVDAQGLAVSVTQSLGSAFGAGFVAGDTGVLMNNLMFFFDLDANSPMSIDLGEMRSGPISPVMVFDEDKLLLMVGTPGAFGIPQTTLQMVSNVVDYQYSVQAAIEAPRFRLYGGRKIGLERRVDSAIVDGLKARGHEVQMIGGWSPAVGGGQGILIDPDNGIYSGGADPRRDGYAIGY
jgi:gamma-glutamyltranspeptidase / glutathione hydrolase